MNLSDGARAALGADVRNITPKAGGDLSDVALLTLADGRQVIAKQAPGALAEAEMLRAIRATGCPAPTVLHAEQTLVLMECLASGARPSDLAWAQAGAAVARLHGARGDHYGWHRDHAFGRVVIPRGDTGNWPEFWAHSRLLAWPDDVPVDIRHRIEALAARLDDLLPADPPAGLLHGDLWAGNLLFGAEGLSGLIDPACAYGDPEADLAMLTLFGAHPPSFFEAYGPLAPGWPARRAIYQLWPALVHLRLFGSGYRPMVERLLDASLA